MKRFYLLTAMLVACGGNVVVDPGHAPGTGGQAQSSGVGVDTGGSQATTSTGSAGSCQTNTCATGPNGACACTGTCMNGATVSAACLGGGAPCTCTLSSTNVSMISMCFPGASANPCDLATGCCASFF
jgi:hypothetical protein